MRLRVSVLLALVSVGWAGPVPAQPIKDPAAVLPAKTLVYVELRQPGQLVKETAALFRGSYLGDVPDSLAKLRAQGQDPPFVLEQLGLLGLLTAPEVVREIGRIDGAAVAVTGLPGANKGEDGKDPAMPEFVVIVLPGESNAPSFLMRAFLTRFRNASFQPGGPGGGRWVEQSFQPVGECEGVRLYRLVGGGIRMGLPGAPPGGAAGKAAVREQGPALAMMPGALLIGSPDAVKDVIRRAKGKSKEPSLVEDEAYQQASKWYGTEPGIFGYSPMPAVFEALPRQGLPDKQQQLLDLVKTAFNPRSVRVKASALTLEKGTLNLRSQYWLNPEEKGRLLEVLPSTPLKDDLLHCAPKDALVFAAVSNGGGAKRWEKALDLADEFAKALNPDGPLPSKQIGQIESKLDIKIGADVMGKVEAIAVAVPGLQRVQEMQKKGTRLAPVVVLVQGTDEEAAGKLAKDLLPRVVAALGKRDEAKPEEKEVDGQRIYTLAVQENGPPLCYGRQGDTIVLGQDANLVAEALNAGAKKRGLLTDEKVGARVKRLEGSVALAVVRPATLGAVAAWPPPPPPGIKPPGAGAGPGATPAPDRPLQELRAALEKEEPLTFGVRRQQDRITIEGHYPGLQTFVPKLTDALIQIRLHPRTALTGKVRYEGKPLTTGTITFASETGVSVTGPIAEDGTFTVTDLKPGTYRLAVATRSTAGKPVVIPDRYGDPETSGLTCTVSRGRMISISN